MKTKAAIAIKAASDLIIEEVDLELVWDPPWTKDMMSEAAKLELNL